MRFKQVVLHLVGAVLVLGLGAPAVTWADCAIAGNLVTNCNFAGGITNWNQLLGTFSHEPTDGSSSAGSMHGVSEDNGNGFWLDFRQCITNPVDTTLYNFGMDVRSTFGTLNGCRIGAQTCNGTSCGAGCVVTQATTNLNTVTGTWTQTSGGTGQITTLAGGSVLLIAACGNGSETSTYTVRFDDIFFGVGLVPVELQTFEVE